MEERGERGGERRSKGEERCSLTGLVQSSCGALWARWSPIADSVSSVTLS